MRIEEDHTILLDGDEIKKLCKIGQGADTCIWVMVSPKGFECSYYNRPTGLVSRWEQGLTNAKRDGCDVVKKLRLEMKYVEAQTLKDILGGPQ